mgnify:CR=1 FL=1
MDALALVDTAGVLSPHSIPYLVQRTQERIHKPLELHFHNDFGHGVVNTIAGHHTPTAAGAFAVESSIVHLADILARALQLGSGGDPTVPPVDHAAWDLLKLKPASLDDIMAAMLAEFDDISSFLR